MGILPSSLPSFHCQGDISSRLCIFHGIGKKIQQYLVKAKVVSQEVVRKYSLGPDLEALALGLHLDRYDFIDVLKYGRQLHLLNVKAGLAAFNLAHIQYIVYQRQEVVG